ncbi:MAG: transcription termination/antitermination protein NusG [Afipia sp.]
MIQSSNSSWFVAQTQPQSEIRAGANLIRQGFEIYLPRYLKTVRHARRVTMVKAPLFPSYIFVKIDAGQRWRAINSTQGVSRLVGHEGVPAALDANVIESLKEREGSDGLFENVCSRARFKAGDAVKVLQGVLDSCQGIFEAETDKERVTILLDMLGRKVRVVTRPALIELA